MSALSNVNWTFIDEHRSSSLIVKSSGDARGIRRRTHRHFSASLSTDLLREQPQPETSSPRVAAAARRKTRFSSGRRENHRRAMKIYLFASSQRNRREHKGTGHFVSSPSNEIKFRTFPRNENGSSILGKESWIF